jgi:hypothetical protein
MTSSRRRSSQHSSEETWWTQYSPTARHLFCLGALLVITLAFFSPILFGGQEIHGTDVVSYRANAEAMIEYEERTGEEALWAPNVFGGMPAFMIGYDVVVPQADTVVNALRSVAFPASHFFVLLVGVYLLVFYLTRNHFSGLLSSIAFGLTTYLPIILAVGHNTKFVALAFAPYVLLAFVYTLRNPSLLGGLLFAAALALDLRAKHPQITYYVLMLALVWWIVEAVWAWREDDVAPFAKSTGWLAMGTGLALLMVAQPYLPLYEYKQYTVRGGGGAAAGEGGGMGWQKAMQWSQGPKELLTLIIAKAFGGGGQMYWGPKTFTEGPHYIGGITAALAGLAVWRTRRRVALGIGVGVLFTVLFSLGKYASWLNWPMFAYFPFFNSFRAPETWLSVSALGLAVLAGIGLDDVMTPSEGEEPVGRTRALLYAFGAVAGGALLLLVGQGLFFDFENPRETQVVQKIERSPQLSRSNPQVQKFYQRLEQRKEQRRSELQADATRTLLAVGVALLLLWLYRRRTLTAWVAGGLVVLVVLVDLWGVARRHLGDDTFSDRQQTESQIPTYPFDRYIKKQVEAAGGPGHFRVFPLRTPYGQNPTSNAIPSYHYQQVGGYHAAKLQRYQNYIDHILRLGSQGGPNENALDLMNTRYVVAQQKLPGTSVAYEDQQNNTLVLENPDAVPRGFLVGETAVVEEPKKQWARLRESSFDPRETALLSAPLDAPVTPIDSGSTAEVTLESYEPPEIRWTVETDAPRLFVASEVYYPAGWKAYLDGEKVPIRPVDYLLRGVPVPAGEHTLVMRFEPRSHRYGLWVSAAATIVDYGGILLLGVPYLRRRLLPGEEETGSTEEEGPA